MTQLVNKVAELLYPLTDFYTSAGVEMPEIEPVEGGSMPEPYRRLLVHDHDMTPTLEAYCGRPIHLRKLAWHEEGGALYRQVVLIAGGEGEAAGNGHRRAAAETAIEFGAIKIYLDRFEDGPRRLILEGHVPLGRILHDHGIEHRSRPSGFFRFVSDELVSAAFDIRGEATLWGRHNMIRDGEGRPLAEVVEVLPPLPEADDEP